MPISKSDIKVSKGKLSILRWDPNQRDNKTVSCLTLRLYNAFLYKEKRGGAIWEKSFSMLQMRSLIDRQTELNIDYCLDQPVILTAQEDDEEEFELNTNLGRPYELSIRTCTCEIGPLPRKSFLSLFQHQESRQIEKQYELDVPKLPDMAALPSDLVYYKIIFSHGREYRLCLPNLHAGKNVFYVQEDLPYEVNRSGPYIKKEMSNIFKIVRL